MKKTFIILAVLIAFVSSIISGCVIHVDKDSDKNEKKSSDVDISEDEDVDYNSLYLDFIEENYSEIRDRFGDTNSKPRFGLAKITDDDIPELFFFGELPDNMTCDHVFIYTIENDTVEQIGEFELQTAGNFLYGEKSNMLVFSSVNFGEGHYYVLVYEYDGSSFEKKLDAVSTGMFGDTFVKEYYGEEAYEELLDYAGDDISWDLGYDVTMNFLKEYGYDTSIIYSDYASRFWTDFECTTNDGTEKLNFDEFTEEYFDLIPENLVSIDSYTHNFVDENTYGLGENVIDETESEVFTLEAAEDLLESDSSDSDFDDTDKKTYNTDKKSDNNSDEDIISAYRDEVIDNSDELSSLTAVKTDLNNDGRTDVIYTLTDRNWELFPHIVLNIDGEMTEVDYSKEISCGSLFPSGRDSDLYYDEDNGIIILRCAGHTEGTAFYHAAEAFKFDGNSLESIWTIEADDSFSENGSVTNEDDVNACYEEFEKRFQEKTEDYNLKALGDYSEDWE